MEVHQLKLRSSDSVLLFAVGFSVDCGGGVFTEPEGVLSSPGYPNAAPLGVNCLYSVSVQPGFMIMLNFSENFHIEQIDAHGPSCLFHWLQVQQGAGSSPQVYS